MSFARNDDGVGRDSDGDQTASSLPPFLLKRLPDERWVQRLTLIASADLALEVIEQTASLLRRAKDLRSLAEDLAVAWIQGNGDLVCGPIRYYAGHRSVTHCTDLQRAVELLLESVGGDLEAFAALLGSSAFRFGGCRSILTSEQFDQVFITEKKIELREGKPHKRLLRTDDRFLHMQRKGGGR